MGFFENENGGNSGSRVLVSDWLICMFCVVGMQYAGHEMLG